MLRPGKYWIGDLCYVMHDVWDEFCNKTIVNNTCIYGEMEVAGKFIAQYGTMYGDGCYHDEDGHEYGVDAGLIGCIRVEDITDPGAHIGLGRIVEFKHVFRTGSTENGVIYFGNVRINTGNSDSSDWEFDSGYDYEDEE